MKTIEKSSLYLYAAYTSSCLEDRAWSFCVSLCMAFFGGIQLVSIEQLAEGLTQIFFSGLLGNRFDKSSRKAAIRMVIPFNNLSLVTSALCFIGCLSLPNDSSFFPVLLIVGIIFCSINRLFLNAEKFIIGRDWVVVISKRNLSDLNAILTSLDQFANVISPLITGALMSFISLKTTCAIFGIGSLVSMVSKIFFLRALYSREEGLHQKETLIEKKTVPGETSSFCERFSNGIRSIPNVISIYYEQTVFSVALGMSLLFMTVLGFDGLAISYGQSTGLPEAVLGGFKSFGSFMGIAGAVSYAFFEKRYGVRKTGLIGLISQHIFTMMALISIWLPGSPMNIIGYFHSMSWESWWKELEDSFTGNGTSSYQPNVDWHHFTSNGNSMTSIFVFLTGIAIARFGLWMADLSVMHIMQVAVPESQRNTVFGVHNSLCQSFSVLKDLLVIALPDPRTFGLCIMISYAFVTTGHLCYVYYIIKYPETAEELDEDKLSHISSDDEKKDEFVRL